VIPDDVDARPIGGAGNTRDAGTSSGQPTNARGRLPWCRQDLLNQS
jgi:hypothetical protein